MVVAGVCGGGLFLLLLVVVFVALVGGGGDERGNVAGSTYTGRPPSTTYTTYSSRVPTSPSPTDGPSTSSTSTGTNGGGSGEYGTPEDNRVYDTGTMAGIGCTAQLPSTDPGPHRRYLQQVIPCLNQAWQAQLANQGIAFQEPGVVVSSVDNPQSPCSSSNVGYTPPAFYCAANQTMYFNLPANEGVHPDYAIRTAAHEYGHHVQNLVGIVDARAAKYGDAAGDRAATTRITRRNELQAQCFAALFLGGNASTMGTSKEAVVENTGADDYVEGVENDPSLRTHGNLRNNRYWLRQGWPGDAGACNTWTASRSRVA